MKDFNEFQQDRLGLSINTLMREILIEHGMPYAEACQVTYKFGQAFDALTGTEWLEVNGTTEWHLKFDGRKPQHISEDERKRRGIAAECPCGEIHPRNRKAWQRRDPITGRTEEEEN